MPADGRRVAVTGGAGFIGHHLVRALAQRGQQVLVIDDGSSPGDGTVTDLAEVARLDISRDALEPVLAGWRPSIVYHLAAQVSVPRSMEDPTRDLEVNALGTLRLLAAARACGAVRVVFTSSGGAVYGNTRRAATEDSPAAVQSYYGAHKLAAESHVRLSGLGYAIARLANVYGPDQPAVGEGAVVAAFVAGARAGRPLVVHGDGSQRRDFVHVHDVVSALVLLGDLDEDGTWNVSSSRATSILELAEMVRAASGSSMPIVHGGRRAGDVDDSLLSNRLLVQAGWRRRWTLERGLADLLAGSGAPTAAPKAPRPARDVHRSTRRRPARTGAATLAGRT